jgi:hypothetical protein
MQDQSPVQGEVPERAIYVRVTPMFTAHAKRLDCQVETVLIWSTLASALGA